MLTALAVCFLVAGAQSSQEVSATLTEVTTVAASQLAGAEVLSTRDIERLVALESEKQLLGCTDSTACLAEVAGAMGARLVIFGELGSLDDQLLLTLNLYDANHAKSVARQIVRGPTLTAVADGIDDAIRLLVTPTLATIDAKPVRLLVMQMRNLRSDTAAVVPPPPAMSGLSLVGVTGVGLGLAAAAVGGAFGVLAINNDGAANKPDTTQVDAVALESTRDQQALVANILYASGAIVALGGAALWIWGIE